MTVASSARRRRIVGLIVLLGGSLVGCGTDSPTHAGMDAALRDGPGFDGPARDAPGLDAPARDAPGLDAPSVPTDMPAMPTSGCGLPATPGTTERHVMVRGVDRTYTVVIPAAYDPDVPHSLVFRFHGWGATGAAAVGGVGLTIPHIIIGPDTDPPVGSSVSWDTTGDLLFVDAMVDALSSELCVDATRNFATGYSAGGFMAHAVGCHRSGTFRGIAIQESGSGATGCSPVGIYIIHNSDDMTVPISYGTGLRDQMIATNGCEATSHPVDPAPCVAYDGCERPVVWCNPPAGGHRPDYGLSLAMGPFLESL